MSKTGTRTVLNGRKSSRGTTLGLRAFEKVSAVEGVRLSREMRRDVKAISARDISSTERTRLITGKYGKR